MRLTTCAVLLIATSLPALAQEPPTIEVFAGYSFLRTSGGGGMQGWNASVAGNLSRTFGLVSDFSGHYGRQSLRTEFSGPGFPGTISASSDSKSSVYLILFGPRFSYRKNERITPFVHALPGAARLSTRATVSFDGLSTATSFANISFAAALGGGVDLKLNDSFALRLIQADYLLTRFGNNTQRSARLSVGIVLH